MQQFLKYPTVFLVGFATTYLLTPVLIRFAKKVNLVDIPDQRRIHTQPIPNIGGLAVFYGIPSSLCDNFHSTVGTFYRHPLILPGGTIIWLYPLWFFLLE